MSFTTVEDAVRRIRRGEIVLVVDDEDRENEGDLTMAADWVTPEAINFMITWGKGLVCMPATSEHLDRIGIAPMVDDNTCDQDTAFCVTIDHASTGSGISAEDRSTTIRKAAHPDTMADDFHRPGHVFPLRARNGGVLERPGHTEAAVDLARLARLAPVAAICEVLTEDGEPARLGWLADFADKHKIAIVSIEQLVAYRHSGDEHPESLAVL